MNHTEKDQQSFRDYFNTVAAAGTSCPQRRAENIFYRAVQSGDVELVTRMIDAWPAAVRWHEESWRDRDYAFEHQCALHIAAKKGDVPMARLLVSRGAQVDAWDAGHCTPLLYAAADGHHNMVVYLLQAGADPSLRGCLGYNGSPLQMAQKRNDQGMAAILATAGAAKAPDKKPAGPAR